MSPSGTSALLPIAINLDPFLGSILADPGQLHQVLMNLAVNARDAMPDGGKLAISTSNVHLKEDFVAGMPGVPPGSYAMLTISDTGLGMSEDVKGHLFEPFFTSKQPGQGTGLGLPTVYGIVRQNRGHTQPLARNGPW